MWSSLVYTTLGIKGDVKRSHDQNVYGFGAIGLCPQEKSTKGITGWYTFKRAVPEERFHNSYNCWWKYLFFGVFTPQELLMILGTPFWGTKLAPASGSNPAQC